jgi:hypothetical protein
VPTNITRFDELYVLHNGVREITLESIYVASIRTPPVPQCYEYSECVRLRRYDWAFLSVLMAFGVADLLVGSRRLWARFRALLRIDLDNMEANWIETIEVNHVRNREEIEEARRRAVARARQRERERDRRATSF